MPRKIIQDIIAKKKRKIVKKSGVKATETAKINNKEKTPVLKIVFWIFVLLIPVIVLGAVLDRFGSAEVILDVRQEFKNIDLKLKAYQNNETAKLNFETMSLEHSMKKIVPSTGTEFVEKKASGKIVVYNTYNSKPQVLIQNTRFETPDGKIYRIDKKIKVPGAPGSVEAVVYADKPGEEYNIGLSDFTIPGFKGHPKYEKFYARSKTIMEGGFSGEVSVASKEDIEAARASLRNSIESYFKETTLKQKPENFLLYDDAIKISFSESENSTGAEVEEKGNAIGFLLNRDELSDFLVSEYMEEKEISKTEILNIENLDFELVNYNSKTGEITFKLKGKGHFAWKINEQSLIEDLIAEEDKNYKQVFGKYPDIVEAEIVFKPSFWRNIPKNPERISVNRVIKSEE